MQKGLRLHDVYWVAVFHQFILIIFLHCTFISKRTDLLNHIFKRISTDFPGSWGVLDHGDIYLILVMAFLSRHQKRQLLISLMLRGDWVMTPFLKAMQQNWLLFFNNQLIWKRDCILRQLQMAAISDVKAHQMCGCWWIFQLSTSRDLTVWLSSCSCTYLRNG